MNRSTLGQTSSLPFVLCCALTLLACLDVQTVSAQDFEFRERLIAIDRDGFDLFGEALAIDGDFLVIGSPQESYDQHNTNASLMGQAGAIYLYRRDISHHWIPDGKLVPSNRGQGHKFGSAVAISTETIVVGAPHFENTNGLETGMAYIFEKDLSGNWTTETMLTLPIEHDIGSMGFSTAIHGSFVFVGAPYYQYDEFGGNQQLGAGTVFVYKKNTAGDWDLWQSIIAPDRFEPLQRGFGENVFCDGNTLVVGAPDDQFPGQINPHQIGAVYTFELDSTDHWQFQQKLYPQQLENTDMQFGSEVVVENDVMVISMRRYSQFGETIIYKKNNGQWQHHQTLTMMSGASVPPDGLAIHNGRITVGVEGYYSTGMAAVFEEDANGDWISVQEILPPSYPEINWFGEVVLYDGRDLILSAPNTTDETDPWSTNTGSGAVFVYRICGNTDSTLNIVADTNAFVSPSGQHLWNTSGTYLDTLWNASGCDSVLTINLTLLGDTSGSGGTSVQDLPFSSPVLSVFPNPVSGTLTIEQTQDSEQLQLELFDLRGRRVMQWQTADVRSTADLSTLTAGIYLLRVRSVTRTQHIRLIKK